MECYLNKNIIGLCFIFHLYPSLSHASVLVSVNQNGENKSIWIGEDKVSIKTEKKSSYTLVDSKQRTLLSINKNKKQITDSSQKIAVKPTLPEIKTLDIQYIHHGKGPIIAGLETEFYLLKVNDEICQSEYLSKLPEFEAGTTALMLMTEYRINTTFKSLPNELSLCFVADNLKYMRYKNNGFPVKLEDQFGKTIFEVTSFDLHSNTPKNQFELPTDFNLIIDNK